MKIERKREPTGFKPVEVVVTLESKDEVDALRELARLVITIPERIGGESGRIAFKIVEGMWKAVRS